MHWLLIIASIGQPVHATNVHVCEINTVHSPRTGDLHFTQVILWRWSPKDKTHRVAQWWIVKDWQMTRDGSRSTVEFFTKGGDYYRVSARSFRPPYPTAHDHEVEDRQHLGECDRRPYFQKKHQ